MKELTIEQKAQRYDEAVGVCRKLYNKAKANGYTSLSEAYEQIFPALKESEDEKSKKWILEYLHDGLRKSDEQFKDHFKAAIAWLEKQGEQKSTDKVKPKFHEGEWITNGDYTWKIVEVKPLDYILQSQDGNIVDATISHVDEQFHSFTIEDAKDGDVLTCESGWTCIFKTLVNDETFSSYCFMDKTKWFCATGSECHTLKEEFIKAYNGKIHPATKGQRDVLMEAMSDNGYTFDFEKKELKKIESTNIPENFEKYVEHLLSLSDGEGHGSPAKVKEVSAELFELAKLEQNPTWSKEDEKEVAVLEAYIRSKDWSERHIDRALGIVDELVNKVKSFRPQNTWKPSDEQIEALDFAADCIVPAEFCIKRKVLKELLEQLKKLKG